MKVVFRADASLQIGTGHVMRCLTLADALAARGAECQFISRAHPGNLIEFLRSRGYIVHALPESPAGIEADPTGDQAQSVAHSHWLGVTEAQDAEVCAAILADLQPDWLIMDHYALDARWERALKPYYGRLMVIDDLADRPHESDLLLDQTYSRKAQDYRAWVPASCRLLCGSQYALLRPEFAALRPYSLQRRNEPQLRQLLITMGGVDKDNATGQVLEALGSCALPVNCRITVVMGASAPWLNEVERLAQNMPWPTQVKVGVRDMAQLMADSDLAIGAAGATTWERCCLGLPTAMLVVAENQRYAARLLNEAQAVRMLNLDANLPGELARFINEVTGSGEYLKDLGERASTITDGEGCQRSAEWLILKGRSMKELSMKLGLLRDIKPDELELMLSWRNAPSVRANMYTRHEISLDEHLQWWARVQSRADQKYFMYESQGTPLGIVAFTGIDSASRNSSWAFYASPQAPKGTGSRMEYMALECAFNELQLHKLCCEVLAFNSPVIKLHQKFGFKVEGILREQHKVEDAFVDVYRLGILATEWNSQREETLEKLLKLANA